MSESVLELRGARLTRSGRHLLSDLTLSLQQGEILALIGPNGAGKSSALKLLSGALTPDAGEVLLRGRPLSAWRPAERATALAYLPQDFTSHWDLTVAELLEVGRLRGAGLTWRGPAAAENHALIGDLALEALLPRRFSSLSGGERARAAMAWALAAGSPVLLADEPTASLDAGHQIELMRLLRRLAGRLSILIVLHDLTLAARFAHRLALLEGGRCRLCATPEAVLASPLLDAAFGVAFHRVATPDGPALVPAAR